jgi:hydroxyacylglutathione hydrolase
MMLEDDFADVTRKAIRGLGLTAGEAAERLGLPENEVLTFLRGDYSDRVAQDLSALLHLNHAALRALRSYQPKPLQQPHVHRLDLPAIGDRVNAWLIGVPGATLLFDTEALSAMGVDSPDHIFITHGHHDHIGGNRSFLKMNLTIHASDLRDCRQISPGDSIQCGPLTVRACELSGHATPGLGYHVEGLSSPVLITGDALFAGSIGGCATPALYQQALTCLQHTLAALADSTILLPGHGPATTLGEERGSNPFL